MKHLGVEIFSGEQAQEQFERDEQECDGCGKNFVPDYDNERRARRGWITYVCDKCLLQGWPWGREYEKD